MPVCVMNTGLPYRAPCEGWEGKVLKRGGCFQHWRSSEAYLQKWRNVTAVKNWLCADDVGYVGATIPPYTRHGLIGGTDPNPNCSSTGVPEDPDYCDEGHPAHTKPPCGPWLPNEFLVACSAGEVRINLNCFEMLSGTKNLALCQKMGFKAVAARKVWHGRYGFDNKDSGVCPGGHSATADQTKYLRMRRSLTGTMWALISSDPIEEDGPFTLNWVREYQVDRDTGIVTEVECLDEWDGGEEWPMAVRTDYLDATPTCGTWGEDDPVQLPDLFTYGVSNWEGSDIVVDNDTAKYTLYRKPPEIDDTAAWRGTVTLTIELTEPYTAEELAQEVTDMLAEWDLADDKTYPWRIDKWTTINPLVSRDEVISPATPDVTAYTDWGMCGSYVDPNDGLYTGDLLGKPFKSGTGAHGYPEAVIVDGVTTTDTFTFPSAGDALQLSVAGAGVVSRVSRWEYDVGLSAYAERAVGVLGTDYTFDAVRGIVTLTANNDPYYNPLRGINDSDSTPPGRDYVLVAYAYDDVQGGIFDYRHENLKLQFNAGLGKWVEAETFYGAYSGQRAPDVSDAVQPYAASQWMTTADGCAFPHGAWTIMLAAGDRMGRFGGQLWMQKYAEIKLPWRSQSWFGPCGKDRDVVYSRTCDVDNECADKDAVFRWPDAWPIEGDRACAVDVGDAKRAVVSPAAEYLRVGDFVDFTNADASTVDNNGGGGYEVTEVETGGGAFKLAEDIPALARVKSHGAPAFWWYDQDGKGEYLRLEHTFNLRDSGLDPDLRKVQHDEYSIPRAVTGLSISQDCLAFDRCVPAVMCFSPNYDGEDPESIDSFDNGNTSGFGASSVDELFGARWQGVFRQVMDDLWWYPPLKPCGPLVAGLCLNACTYAEDTLAQCPAVIECDWEFGGAVYYPHRPIAEARNGVPAAWNGDSAPAVMTVGAGVQVYANFLTFAEMQSAGANGIAAQPMGVYTDSGFLIMDGSGEGQNDLNMPDVVDDMWVPWGLFRGFQDCACNEGSFAEEYGTIIGARMCV